jgi:hypothetical protein
MTERKFFTRADAAKYIAQHGLPVNKRSLDNMAAGRWKYTKGPEYTIIGDQAIYLQKQLDAWLNEQSNDEET